MSRYKIIWIFFFLFIGVIIWNKKDKRIHQKREQAAIITKYLDRISLTAEDLELSGKVKRLIEYELINEGEISDYPGVKDLEKNNAIIADSINKGDYYLVLKTGEIRRLEMLDIEKIETFRFNEKGDVEKRIWYGRSNDGKGAELEENQYDRAGNLIAQRKFDFYGNLYNQIEFAYDRQGRMIKTHKIGSNEKWEENYNISYHLDTTFIERIDTNRDSYFPRLEVYDVNGVLVENDPRIEKKYRNKGEFQKSIDYFMYGEKLYSETYEYDPFGNEIARTEYDSSGNINHIERKYYDDLNKLFMVSEIDGNSYRVKKMNNYGFLSESTSTWRNSDTWNLRDYREAYNQNGNVIHMVEVIQGNDGQITESRTDLEYEYDDFRNWVVKKRYEGDSLLHTMKRVIIYY